MTFTCCKSKNPVFRHTKSFKGPKIIKNMSSKKYFLKKRKLLNPPKITLNGNCHSTAPRRATQGSQGAIVKIMGTAIFHIPDVAWAVL